MNETKNVYIVEDIAIARASLEAMLLENDFNVIGSAAKAETAWKELQHLKVDLLLVDINLAGKKNGVWLVEQIRKYYNIPVVFLTAYGDQKTIKKVLNTNPNGYLMKPYQEVTLITTINIALENFDKLNKEKESVLLDEKDKNYPEYLFVKKNKKVVKLNVSTINYVQVEEKYCKLQCDETNYLIKMSLKKVQQILSKEKFKQVHRSFIVNTEKIKEIYFEDSLIILLNNDKLPFSDHYKAIFRSDNDIFC